VQIFLQTCNQLPGAEQRSTTPFALLRNLNFLFICKSLNAALDLKLFFLAKK
jgi:hypothetical protein